MPNEVEIKFLITDIAAIRRAVERLGFQRVTPRTHEMNTLYDRADGSVRQRGEILRVRNYGGKWRLTHKSKSVSARHKVRDENEANLEDGEAMERILAKLGYAPTFRYEKYRAEYVDGTGHIVIDETPVGIYGEIEGPPDWIEAIAAKLHIAAKDYIKGSYADLFFEWKRHTGSSAEHMTFAECGTGVAKS